MNRHLLEDARFAGLRRIRWAGSPFHHLSELELFKMRLIAILLSVTSVAAFAQASAPADSASAPAKHRLLTELKKLGSHEPAASPDKKGDQ